jgi:hypothetical protein
MIGSEEPEFVSVPFCRPEETANTKLSACERLDSWKEIAGYLRRSVRCAQRWERREGLPILRHMHARSSTVYAYRQDLDCWWHGRGNVRRDSQGVTMKTSTFLGITEC